MSRRAGSSSQCVESPYVRRIFGGMEQARFDLRLPLSQRRELAVRAAEIGLSSADLARLGIRYILQHPEVILRPVATADAQAEARS